jgi:hypothetical protein
MANLVKYAIAYPTAGKHAWNNNNDDARTCTKCPYACPVFVCKEIYTEVNKTTVLHSKHILMPLYSGCNHTCYNYI